MLTRLLLAIPVVLLHAEISVSGFLIPLSSKRTTRFGLVSSQFTTSRRILPALQDATSSQHLEDEYKTVPQVEELPKEEDSTSWNLWLDLRQTAIHPEAALNFLQDELGDFNVRSAIQRILVSAPPPSYSSSPCLVCVHSETQTLHTFQEEESVVGKIVDPQSILTNPFPVLEALSCREWVLIDSVNEEEVDTSSIAALLQLASSSTSTSTALIGGVLSLAIPTADNDIDQAQSQCETEKGGIAIGCSTPTAFLQMTSTLQNLGQSTTSTDSGIVLPTAPTATSRASTNTFNTALCLPLEVKLWKTALWFVSKDGDDDRA